MFPWVALWLNLAATARAELCERSTSTVDVDGHLAAAEAHYWALKQESFEAEASAAEETLRCMGEPVTLALVARLHRVEGLRAWLRHDAEATSRAFATAKWLDPGYSFPPELEGVAGGGDVPAEAPERAIYNRVLGEAPRSAPVAPPASGTFTFDAQLGLHRPVERGTVFQQLDTADHPLVTRYLAASDALPVVGMEAAKPTRRPVAQWAAGGASAGLLAAGAVLYGTGRWGWGQDAYTNLANTNPPEAEGYYWGELYPRMAVGVGLAAVGGAGLVGTGIWMMATPQTGGVGVSGKW